MIWLKDLKNTNFITMEKTDSYVSVRFLGKRVAGKFKEMTATSITLIDDKFKVHTFRLTDVKDTQWGNSLAAVKVDV